MIELLVVIAIIGVLAVRLITAINPLGQFQKAQDAQRKSDLAQTARALEQYNNDHGAYPNSTGNTGNATKYQIIDFNGSTITWGTSWGSYLLKVPKDPNSTKNYVYIVSANKQSYWLYAALDRASDPQACNGGSSCTNAPAGNQCGAACNYGLSSTNTTP